MNILAIETSCDETACAIVEDGSNILSNIVNSQIDIHKIYGGVVPEIAARSHIEAIMPVVEKAISDSKITWEKIDAIAVTHTPGLLGSLLVGTLTARTLAILHNKPLYAIHHLKSHIYANWLETTQTSTPQFPLLALVISGGHTQIIKMDHHNDFHIIGSTRDDAVGEVFDKVAKILGLPYPGGPSIAQSALKGNPEKYQLPIPQVDNLDFSFSGLKTAVLRRIQKELNLPISTPSFELKKHLAEQQINDFAASFQATVSKIFIKKITKALEENPSVKSLVIAGGVSANQNLKENIQKTFENQVKIHVPNPKFSTDNAAMVASAAFYSIQSGQKSTDPYSLDISPRSVIS